MSGYETQMCSCGHVRAMHDPWERCISCWGSCGEFKLHERHFRHDQDAWKQLEFFGAKEV